MEALLTFFVVPFIVAVVLTLVVLGCVAYTTLLERKVIAYMQVRLGPNRVGWWGLLQPVADVVKLFLKEDLVPRQADRWVFNIAPILCAMTSLAALAVIPWAGPEAKVTIFGYTITPWLTDVNVGLLYILSISSIGVFGIVLGGWASNSKYPLLGGLRSAAQMISYEVPFGLTVIGALMVAGTASMVEIVKWQQTHAWMFILQPFGVIAFYIAGLAENNRSPFDLPEAENELVAGFHTEYSGMKFAFFFLAEYISMIVISAMVTTVFLGGWLPITFGLGYLFPEVPKFLGGAWGGPWGMLGLGIFWFGLKTFLVLNIYLWVRATFPRYRYDQLMNLGWRWMIPASLIWVLGTGAVLLVIQHVRA